MIRIFVPTPLSAEELEKTFPQNVSKMTLDRLPKDQVIVEYIYNNNIGLSKLYNKILLREKTNNPKDIVLFIHDDVEIHDCYFVGKLQKAHEEFDIVGLAGGENPRYDMATGQLALWHTACSRNSLHGIVAHYIPKDKLYNSVYFGGVPHKVDVIDGLFMSFNLAKIEDVNIFDEDFEFHHYDLAMCENASINNLSIGVWLIFVVHHGLGEFNNDIWKKSNEQFIKKYA